MPVDLMPSHGTLGGLNKKGSQFGYLINAFVFLISIPSFRYQDLLVSLEDFVPVAR